ncbi:MAG: zinc ribbon domain-containing protein [Chloroflexales bacterium]|nr:zinc ribbon domain-containing protein [Chloroflexales bacterium]
MPLYEYHCQECGERFEKLLRMSDDAKAVRCPACAGASVERLLSSFATSGKQSGASSAASCGPVG